GGVFLIGLALAFFFSSRSDGGLFLPILFVTIGFTSLLGAASSGKANGLYGGIQSLAWFVGLAFCFYFGFWPWILVVIGVSAILGALIKPITEGLVGLGLVGLSAASRPQQQYQPNQPSYQPYQQGYQPP